MNKTSNLTYVYEFVNYQRFCGFQRRMLYFTERHMRSNLISVEHSTDFFVACEDKTENKRK